MYNTPNVSHTNFTSPLFFNLILCSFILISFRLCDALAFYYVFLILLPITSITLSSILHPLSTFHPPSLCHSVTLVPVLCPLSPPITSFHIPVSQLIASPFCSIFIFSTSIHYSLPPRSDFVYLTFHSLWLHESFPTFSILLHLLYYSKPCSL